MTSKTMMINNRLVRFSHESAYLNVVDDMEWKFQVAQKIHRYNNIYDFDYYLYVTWEEIIIRRHDPQLIIDFPII